MLVQDKEVLILESSIVEYPVKIGSFVYVKQGQVVRKGEKIADFDPYNEVFISEHDGIVGFAMEKGESEEQKNKSILVIYNDKNKELERFVLVNGTALADYPRVKRSSAAILSREGLSPREGQETSSAVCRESRNCSNRGSLKTLPLSPR